MKSSYSRLAVYITILMLINLSSTFFLGNVISAVIVLISFMILILIVWFKLKAERSHSEKIEKIAGKCNKLDKLMSVSDKPFEAEDMETILSGIDSSVSKAIITLEKKDKEIEDNSRTDELEEMNTRIYQRIGDVLFEYRNIIPLISDLLSSAHSGIEKASSPLSNGIYEIKKSTTDFLEKISFWYKQLEDESSDKNFQHIVDLLNFQERSFDDVSNSIDSNIGILRKEFSDVFKRIGNIDTHTQHIDDIASQIKTLSLNAAIEAARAGSYGSGFKVIAGETKKLSDTTNSILGEIMKEVQNTKERMDEVIMNQKNVQHNISVSITRQKKEFAVFRNVLKYYR